MYDSMSSMVLGFTHDGVVAVKLANCWPHIHAPSGNAFQDTVICTSAIYCELVLLMSFVFCVSSGFCLYFSNKRTYVERVFMILSTRDISLLTFLALRAG